MGLFRLEETHGKTENQNQPFRCKTFSEDGIREIRLQEIPFQSHLDQKNPKTEKKSAQKPSCGPNQHPGAEAAPSPRLIGGLQPLRKE
jgi:hypothetical protein